MKKLSYILIILLLAIIIVPALWSTAQSQFKVNNASSNKIKVTNLQKGLVGHWDMDQTSLKSSTVLADKTPNGNNGTISGATFTTDRNSQNNKAMSFDGNDDYISTNIGASTIHTIALWVKASSYYGKGIILRNWGVDASFQIDLRNTGFVGMEYRIATWPNWDVYSNSVTYTLGDWVHLAVVRNGTSVVFYANGNILSSHTLSSGGNSFAFTSIGRGSDQWSPWFNGSMDDLRIYNRALSTTEVTQLYGSYNPKVQVSTLQKGLVGYWPLDQQSLKSSTITADKTVNANDGTMVGSPTFTTDQKGQTGKAMSFNGSSQYAILPSHQQMQTNSTFSCWLKFNTDSGLLGSDGTYNHSDIFIYTSRVQIRLYNTAEKYFYFNNYPSSGVWFNLTIVNNNNNWLPYINGDASYTSSLNSSQNLYWKWLGRNAVWYFNGSLADVRIYNRALSATEVRALYEMYE